MEVSLGVEGRQGGARGCKGMLERVRRWDRQRLGSG